MFDIFIRDSVLDEFFSMIFISATQGQHRMLQHSLLPGPAQPGHPCSSHSSKNSCWHQHLPQDEPWAKLHFGSLNFSEISFFPFAILLAFQIKACKAGGIA